MPTQYPVISAYSCKNSHNFQIKNAIIYRVPFKSLSKFLYIIQLLISHDFNLTQFPVLNTDLTKPTHLCILCSIINKKKKHCKLSSGQFVWRDSLCICIVFAPSSEIRREMNFGVLPVENYLENRNKFQKKICQNQNLKVFLVLTV